jgi:hypothetical protein
LHTSSSKPYEKQAAADKERAEREKKQYEGGVPAKKPTSKKAAAPYVSRIRHACPWLIIVAHYCLRSLAFRKTTTTTKTTNEPLETKITVLSDIASPTIRYFPFSFSTFLFKIVCVQSILLLL